MAGLYNPPPNYYATLLGGALKKRKTFFSFHYDDIMRVNVVRKAWEFADPTARDALGFYDGSLWESKKATGPDAVKNLIRDGVHNTSAVCVLIGTETWLRRWVKYEIARAVIDGRGLLGVHLNSIRHITTQTAHAKGSNPFEFLAVGKVQEAARLPPRYYLFEKNARMTAPGVYGWSWDRYSDYTQAVDLPLWLRDPAAGYVTPLSYGAPIYDYIADDGHHQIGRWIDNAARAAGR
jgi:hypothetical protein